MIECIATPYTGALPLNFLPVALPVLQNGPGTGYLPMVFQGNDGGVTLLPVAERDISDQNALTDIARAIVPTEAIATTTNTELATGQGPAAFGIIDTGIAFWNPVFSDGDQPRFAGMGVLGFDPATGALPFDQISKSDLKKMVKAGRTPAGDRQNRADLGQRFPHSVFAPFRGTRPLLGRDTVSHGTAMSDIAAQSAGPDVPFFGVELPAAVLLDSSGVTLQGMLEVALRRLVSMMQSETHAKRHARFVVLAPFAFLGGPHDGARSILSALQSTLQEFRDGGLDVTLVVPMGNHLAQQAHLRLPNGNAGPVRWRVMPDDGTANTVDILHHEARPTMSLTLPNGEVAQIGADAVNLLRLDGKVIGAVWTADAGGGYWRTRITLAPTTTRSWAEGGVRAPAGVYEMQIQSGTSIDAWILRDDAVLGSRNLPPSRQARFVDPAYRPMAPGTRPAIDDTTHPGSAVRRMGTASMLATGTSSDGSLVAVAAGWQEAGQSDPALAPYSGQYQVEWAAREAELEVVDQGRPGRGMRAVGTGQRRSVRVSGTSVAAAKYAGRLASGAGVKDAPNASDLLS